MKFKIGDKVMLGGPDIHIPFNGLVGVVDRVDTSYSKDFPYKIRIKSTHGNAHPFIHCDGNHIKLTEPIFVRKYIKRHKL